MAVVLPIAGYVTEEVKKNGCLTIVRSVARMLCTKRGSGRVMNALFAAPHRRRPAPRYRSGTRSFVGS